MLIMKNWLQINKNKQIFMSWKSTGNTEAAIF